MSSNKHNKNNKNKIYNSDEKYTIESGEVKYISSIKDRMDKIKNLLDSSNLNEINPLNNIDSNADTDIFEGVNEIKENKSFDSRIILGKKDQNFYKIINKMNSKIKFFKAGAYGNCFKATIFNEKGEETVSYGLKVVAYTKKNGSIHDIYRPENAEINMLKLLSYFVVKDYTPHIVLPIGIFNTSIKPFVEDIDDDVKNNKKYKEFLDNYRKKIFHNKVSVIISEWANRGDLGMFLRKHYENLQLIHWKCIFFQIISTLAKIQIKYPSFRHNDLKANNLLVSKTDNGNICSVYSIEGDIYYVPGMGYFVYLWDFDFSCIPGVVENTKVYTDWSQEMNITSKQNRYYDLHYFFCTLVYKGFLPDFFNSTKVPKQVKKFVKYVIPDEYKPEHKSGFTNERCRLLNDKEYILPIDLLKHEFFSCFREENQSKG
jgi:hypothetical protein